MLAPDVRVVAVEVLRPPAGFKLEQAVLTTYSLDLEALLALPLAVMGYADEGLDALLADPLLLIEGLREARSKLHVFVDQGGVAVPHGARELYSLLEPCVHAVKAPNGGLFHPKVWVARFVDEEGNVRLRVAVLSRNLTYDRSWDVAVTTEGTPAGKRRVAASRPLSELFEHLPSWVEEEDLSGEVRQALAQISDELARTKFAAPEGYAEPLVFHASGFGSRKKWSPRAEGWRALAISPFVTRGPIEWLSGFEGARTLIARQEELDALPAEVLEGWEVLVLCDEAVDEQSEEALSRFSRLHAKVVAIEHGHDVTWYAGSTNLTHAAWNGENVEVMVELNAKKGRANGKTGEGIDRFFESGFRGLCESYSRNELEEQREETTAAQKKLRLAWNAVLEAELRIDCSPSGEDGWSWQLEGELSLPDGVKAEVWPVSVSSESAREVDLPLTWILPTTRVTAFVAFRLSVPGSGAEVEQLTRKLPATGMPEGRINHVLESLISTPERLLRFLRALLGGLEGLVGWNLAGDGDEDGSEGAWSRGFSGETLLEDLVRTASRDPKRLEPIRKILKSLASTEEGRKKIPDGLLEAWHAVEGALLDAAPTAPAETP